ncbi:MAG: hemolysin family protein [Pseudomonadota bacterium]
MPDGSEPSSFAAVATHSPRGTDTSDAAAPERKRSGFSALFGRRGKGANETTIKDGHGGERHLSATEKAMIGRVVALENVRVGDVAIPRADIIGVEVSESLSTVLSTFAEAGHSRLPVYRQDPDDPLGFVHIKDVVTLLAQEGGCADDTEILPGIVRKLLYAPPSMPVAQLLLRMQAERIHMALVIDEFGGTDGLVTIEDLIEEIVGDIRDEHDEAEESTLRRTPGGRWDVDARVELDDLAIRLETDLRTDEEEIDTLGGLVFSLAGRVPLRGEVIPHPAGHEFEIAEADPRRVRRVLIRLHTTSADKTEQAHS